MSLAPGSSSKEVTFATALPNGLLLQQTFRFRPDDYLIDVFVAVTNDLDRPVEGNFTAAVDPGSHPPPGAAGQPPESGYLGISTLMKTGRWSDASAAGTWTDSTFSLRLHRTMSMRSFG